MKIFISHSQGYDFENELYKPLLDSPLAKEHTFIFPHSNSSEPFDVGNLFHNHGCDLVIAEVSYATTGQGIELGWANLLNIPIICIYKQGTQLTGALSEVTKKFLMYTSPENMIADITQALKAYEPEN